MAETKMFCPITGNLLHEAIANGELVFKSNEGIIYKSDVMDTLLHTDDFSDALAIKKNVNTLTATAFDPVNPRIEGPCPNCQRKIVSYQIVGENKQMVHSCICGAQW